MSTDGFDNKEFGDLAKIEIVTHPSLLGSDYRIFLNGIEISHWVSEVRYEVSGEDKVPVVWFQFAAEVTVLSEMQKVMLNKWDKLGQELVKLREEHKRLSEGEEKPQ